jgi:hypothetical protein
MLRIPHCLDNRLIDGGKIVNKNESHVIKTIKYSMKNIITKMYLKFLSVLSCCVAAEIYSCR